MTNALKNVPINKLPICAIAAFDPVSPILLTFSIRYFEDYKRAGIPTISSVYGNKNAQLIIALSSFGAALSIGLVAFSLGLSWGYLRLLAVLATGIIGLALLSVFRPSEKINFGLFKYASMYMFGAMIMVILGTVK